ncbi:hypothetical protein HPB50_007543 [Hyalomma asiaticum]|uniref:Uncharacterized protein n=1 Tax=Hyalomma asiaticum TaxID=266040 RepID=A0ACB7RK47_HYAAI|nr:hypothetical protein HPB50_007543 [Hyalomma asiaticum]
MLTEFITKLVLQCLWTKATAQRNASVCHALIRLPGEVSVYQPDVRDPNAAIVSANIWPYICQYCDKTFPSKWSLQRHGRVHTDYRPFGCTFCPKAFKQKAALNNHMRCHTGDKPYRCQFCGMAFSWKSSFDKHLQKHGSERDPLLLN